jgi:polar amino acid transport system substrate-binding protein
MKVFKHWAARVGLALGLAAGLASPAAAQGQSLVKEVKSRGTLKVGMAESPPWQSPNPQSGQYEGFNVDLAKRVADIMGVKLEIVPATWATLVPGLEPSSTTWCSPTCSRRHSGRWWSTSRSPTRPTASTWS